ncbi:MAG: asparagine synthetase B [Archaeoglobus sp.]|nr:MAG: asparagine synthetase B [Archaeoglobus sp.]
MLYACLQTKEGVSRILTNAQFPCKQHKNVLYDASEESELKICEDMPLRVKGFYSVVAFKAKHILLSRDVIGGMPLYYSTTEFSSFRSLVDSANPVNPGEVVKISYDGEISIRKFSFDDVFKPSVSESDSVEEFMEVIEKKLSNYKHGDCVAFSGGVDSSLLASMYDVPLVSVTASEKEEEHIRWAAKEIGRDVYIFRFNEKVVKEVLPEVVKAIEESNPFHVSIGVPVYLALKKAKELGFKSMMFGQGADELFGGYKKYENYAGKDELFWILKRDVEMLGVNNLERDTKLAYKNGIKLMTPYLQWEIIKVAMKIPGNYKLRKVNGEIVRKYILRKIAEKYLPRELAYKQKKAVQYSTKTVKLLKRIAKTENMSIEELLSLYKQA